MKRFIIVIQAVIVVLAFASGHIVWADDYEASGYSDVAADSGDSLFTPDELDDLLAPIALYPDPLIAQILPAATFIDQIDEATRYVRQYGVSSQIDDQSWDVSVKAIAHYPTVLFMMDQKYDWTISLGQAFVNQEQDVTDAIQRLRARAEAEGNLVSTPQQQVIVEDDFISIVPAEPNLIYVPQYDPQEIYVERLYPSYGFINFGIGYTIGAWLNRDFDWRRHRVYYHGWRGGGWIGRTRTHIPIRNNVYINNRNSRINVNRRVIQHDTGRYREDIRRDVRIRRERGAPLVPRGPVVRPRERIENRNVPQTRITPAARPPQHSPAGVAPVPPRSATGGARETKQPDKRDRDRGREEKGAQPSSSNQGYGGYGNSKEATTIRERGRTSRENMRQFNRQQSTPVPVRTPVPAPRPSGPGVRRQSAPVVVPHVPPPAVRQTAPPAVRQAPNTVAPVKRRDTERR
ncbi:MAG: DUF3300 domain-containing protein [Proteobacteria bacterium]|nr:DUF3300 domain-containing protein [Pseudomonadota bacterium]